MLRLFHKCSHFTRCVFVCRIIRSLFLTVCAHVFPLLSGGYENFHSQYPELCTEVKTIDQSGTETEKRVNSHSDKLSHHKPDYDQVWKHPYNTAHALCLPYRVHIHCQFLFLTFSQKRERERKQSPADIRVTYIWHQPIITVSQHTSL